jgi:hypothetical protein
MTANTVSRNALLRRVNHALSYDGLVLKKANDPDLCRLYFGEYYCLDLFDGIVTNKDVDIELFARNVDVLQDWEVLDQ